MLQTVSDKWKYISILLETILGTEAREFYNLINSTEYSKKIYNFPNSLDFQKI